MGLCSDSLPVAAIIAGRKRYISDSMQFMLELGCRVSGRPTYYIMPSARGENPDPRHLTEFCHVEVEVLGSLREVMAFAERYLMHLNAYVLEHVHNELRNVAGDVNHIAHSLDARTLFRRLTFAEAYNLCNEARLSDAFERLPNGDLRITNIGETHLINTFGDFVWLTHMPSTTVPFYQRRSGEFGTALNADLLAGIGEILGCGERVHTYEEAIENLSLQSIPASDYAWYCEMKRRDPRQTSGFGMGIERYLLWAMRHADIRDVTLILRDWRHDNYP